MRRNVRLRWLDEVCRWSAGLRDEETEIQYSRNDRRIRQRCGRLQVNAGEQGLTCYGRASGRPERTVSLHPGLMVVPRRLRGIVAIVLMARMPMVPVMVAKAMSRWDMQQCGREPFRANLQHKLAIPTGHEPDGDERTKRQRYHQEAGEPTVLTQICESNGHWVRPVRRLLYPGTRHFDRSAFEQQKRHPPPDVRGFVATPRRNGFMATRRSWLILMAMAAVAPAAGQEMADLLLFNWQSVDCRP
jgi:hypothetical protein